MQIAITGASGHVGANLCRTLIEKKLQVKVLIHHDHRPFKHLPLQMHKGNILDPGFMNQFVSGSDVVIHLAAHISIHNKDNKDVILTNVTGTKNVIDACISNNISKLIHFSSIHAFNQFPLDSSLDETRELVADTSMNYDFSKAAGETLVAEAVNAHQLNAVILSPTSVIGPYDFKPSLMGMALLKFFKGSLPALLPGGYDWVDVRDIVDSVVFAIHKEELAPKYIFSGKWVSLAEMASLSTRITGKKITRFICPLSLAKMGTPFLNLPFYLRGRPPLYTKQSLSILVNNNFNINSTLARKDLGFSPRPVESTLRDTYEWFLENGYLK